VWAPLGTFVHVFQTDARGRVDALRPGFAGGSVKVTATPFEVPAAGDWFIADDAVGAEAIHLVAVAAADPKLASLADAAHGARAPRPDAPALGAELDRYEERALGEPAQERAVESLERTRLTARLRAAPGPLPLRVTLRFDHR
jgi:hypothetical protein